MPRLNENILNCAFYLYPTEEGARQGDGRGGCGFVLAVFDGDDRGLIYAVTAGHVVGQASVLRFNTLRGEVFVVSIEESKWRRSVDHDLAVTPLHSVAADELDLFLMPASLGVTRDRCVQDDIGVGDEIFLVGRFLGHDGRERNLPTARFGNIAMMPQEPIRNQVTGLDQESFLVEMRSVSGYSGSPVFLFRGETFGPETRLLGVLWGHIEHQVPAEGTSRLENAGMAGVVPFWGLLDLLYEEDVVQERRALINHGISRHDEDNGG